MKKLFLFVVAMASFMSLSLVYAKDIVIILENQGPTLKPRSEIPVITASIDDGICRTNVSEYSGNVLVAIKDAAGDTLISQTEAVFDSTQIVTNVSSLDDGSYTITYTLEDSTIFSGEFEKE
jgi:hypothetical protein